MELGFNLVKTLVVVFLPRCPKRARDMWYRSGIELLNSRALRDHQVFLVRDLKVDKSSHQRTTGCVSIHIHKSALHIKRSSDISDIITAHMPTRGVYTLHTHLPLHNSWTASSHRCSLIPQSQTQDVQITAHPIFWSCNLPYLDLVIFSQTVCPSPTAVPKSSRLW